VLSTRSALGLSKAHCCSCVDTAASAIVAVGKRGQNREEQVQGGCPENPGVERRYVVCGVPAATDETQRRRAVLKSDGRDSDTPAALEQTT
jgi:hypothetical protein